MVDLRRQEFTGVRVRGSCDAQELTVDAWGGREALQDLPAVAHSGGTTDASGW
jgi:hypothetical protein